MSIRTLIEINHDQLHRLQERPDLLALIIGELASSIHNGPLNKANSLGMPLNIGHGVSIVLQRHHSTDVTVTTEYQTVKL